MDKQVNCIIVDDEPVAREILVTHLEKIDTIRIAASCKNAMDAFRIVNTQHIDLVFLDINMPDISGLSFAKSMSKEIKVIFTTAYREYAVDGFDLKAVDYLIERPYSFEEAIARGFRNSSKKAGVRCLCRPKRYRSNRMTPCSCGPIAKW